MTERPIERWARLRSSDEGDGAIEVPSLSSGVDTGFGPVRFAIGPEGQPRLMVPCGTNTTLTERASTGRLSVTLSRFVVSGRSALFIDVMSTERSLDAVFADLADEIVHRVQLGEGPVDAVEGTIADFQALLQDQEGQSIPDQQILGLVGELVVLRDLVCASPSAIGAWTGPYEQRHDFRRGEHALEVKTSSRVDATEIFVSSCEQLTEPSGGTLALVHVKVERTDQGPLTVLALTAEILRAGALRQALQEALAALGCHDASSPEWNRISFNLEAIDAYRVEAQFPRITAAMLPRGTLPNGINSLTYSVNLDAARQYQMSSDELNLMYERIAL